MYVGRQPEILQLYTNNRIANIQHSVTGIYMKIISLFTFMETYSHVHICYSSVGSLQDGITPLYMASQTGHTSVVDILLRHGVDPNLALTVSGLIVS